MWETASVVVTVFVTVLIAPVAIRWVDDLFNRRSNRHRDRRAFQRSTLLELQEAVKSLMILTHEGHAKQVTELASKSLGVEIPVLDTTDYSSAMRLKGYEVTTLRVRLLDDQLRDDVEALRLLLMLLLFDHFQRMDEREERLERSYKLFSDINDRIGHLLREVYP